MTSDSAAAAAEFHDRVKAACWDGLAGQLAMLHQPHLDANGTPRCHGCDQSHGDPEIDAPVWPCRTYTIIATAVLAEPEIGTSGSGTPIGGV
jgi:hypothetical protein